MIKPNLMLGALLVAVANAHANPGMQDEYYDNNQEEMLNVTVVHSDEEMIQAPETQPLNEMIDNSALESADEEMVSSPVEIGGPD